MAKREVEASVVTEDKPFAVEVANSDRLARLLIDDAQHAGCHPVSKVNANKLRYTVTFAETESVAMEKVEAYRKKRADEETKLQKLMRQPIIGVSHGPIGA